MKINAFDRQKKNTVMQLNHVFNIKNILYIRMGIGFEKQLNLFHYLLHFLTEYELDFS
jgi:hypothetical protein